MEVDFASLLVWNDVKHCVLTRKAEKTVADVTIGRKVADEEESIRLVKNTDPLFFARLSPLHSGKP